MATQSHRSNGPPEGASRRRDRQNPLHTVDGSVAPSREWTEGVQVIQRFNRCAGAWQESGVPALAALRPVDRCHLRRAGDRLRRRCRRHHRRLRQLSRPTPPDQPRRQLQDPELPRVQPDDQQLQLRRHPQRVADHLRQRRFHGQHVVQRQSRSQALVRQRLDHHAQSELPEHPDPGREDRQGESARPALRHHRRPLHLDADDPGPVRPGHRHRHQLPGVDQRPAQHHGRRRPQRHGCRSHLRESHRHLARRRHAGAAHVLQRRQRAHLRQLPHRQAGRQFVINLTVVLNNTPPNAPGTQFINTAKWDFGRLIDGTFYEPLPGENGISPPLTTSGPAIVVDKTGPATMNLGQWGDFALDVQNTGSTDAWDVSLRDLFPDGPTGGMCDLTPQILSAQVFAADGVTPVPGKGPLIQGTDYTLSWSGAPACRLDMTMLTAAGRIGASERLIVRYRTQLDANTQDGITLTNVAGAIQWFNGDATNPNRIAFNKTLTNGTVGVADHEDAHTVTVDLLGYFFEKTVANVTSGANPATTAAPGDTLRYTLRFQTTDQALANFRIDDVMDALNAPPAFAAGTLTLVSVPSGADVTNTNSNGGPSGTGVLDVRNLSLPLGSQFQIVFDITLRLPLANGTVVTDQATFRQANGTVLGVSDDPNVNGQADPFVAGDEDPTRVTIVSAPAFRIQKISTDLTGDPSVLLAGETLRYTITVANIGNENAVNVALRDAVPVNTTYVAGSTTLNGVAVADVAGLSPLVNGLLIHPPSNPTPGTMPADPSAGPTNVATITFDVVISSTVPNGTVISNQGFVTAGTVVVNQPSDDPGTPVPNDPTRDVVGNFPLLYATKTVPLLVDLGTPGVVDPGDTLRYTITVQNSATLAATGVVLTDGVPANTTYVADSTQLNGLPVGQPDGGVSPLAAGINISSSDLTPPLPGPGAGTISPGASAVLQFNLRVNLGTPAGTLITNQAVVDSVELPNLLTDGDGNPGNGAQPTVVVVGAVQQLSISNQVSVVGGGPAIPGAQLEYVVTVVNTAAVPALNVVITDTLPLGQLAYVAGSATMNGSATGVSVVGSTITADYAAVNGTLPPGGVVVLQFRAVINPALANGTVVTNTGTVSWNAPTQTASASVSIVVGSIPGLSLLSGSVWHDKDFDDTRDPGERALAAWTVELYRNGVLWNSALTDAAGDYRFTSVDPNDTTGVQYEVRFHAPGAGPNTAMLGRAASPFTNGPGLQHISGILVPPGTNVQGLNLPIDPNGVVYNSMARIPVVGATLTLLNASSGSPLPTGCFDDAAQQGQVTLADGWYKFDINFSDSVACRSGAGYLIVVTPPPGTYVAGTSQIIPPPVADATA